jgi:uncharacterized membrane protein HdeD (DUF308 family)
MKVDLNKWYKCDIDKQVYQNLIKRSDWQGIKHVFLWIIVLVFSGYMAFINWELGGLYFGFLFMVIFICHQILYGMTVVINLPLSLAG